MAAYFDRDLKRILLEAGCYFVRPAKGSHELWYSPLTKRQFTVPVNVAIRHTANGILKEAGLPKAF
jgi:predicted RNA binding protein YcfA (HicA-like mRNA interferase family)